MAIMEDIWETVARMEPKSVAKACSKASSLAATHDIQNKSTTIVVCFRLSSFRRFTVSDVAGVGELPDRGQDWRGCVFHRVPRQA